jgi:hypothetical protein
MYFLRICWYFSVARELPKACSPARRLRRSTSPGLTRCCPRMGELFCHSSHCFALPLSVVKSLVVMCGKFSSSSPPLHQNGIQNTNHDVHRHKNSFTPSPNPPVDDAIPKSAACNVFGAHRLVYSHSPPSPHTLSRSHSIQVRSHRNLVHTSPWYLATRCYINLWHPSCIY